VIQLTIKFESVPVAELEAKQLRADSSPVRPVALVVDDQRLIADTLAVILNNAGYAATAAYDAESAMDMASIVPPELLITDVFMPGMDGIELAFAMKKVVPDCRILLFSGQAANANLLLTAHGGGHDFAVLAKPIHPHDLLAHVSRLSGIGDSTFKSEG